MRVFKNKWFARFARQEDINDLVLCAAIERAERGLIDADLGGSVIKQRIARANEGKSGGFRSIILVHTQERAVFVFGFAKNKKANISQDELNDFRDLAQEILTYTNQQMQTATALKKFIEVICHD